MTKILIGLMCMLTISLFSQHDRYHVYRIIGDNVNVRSDTGLSSKVIAKANFGDEFSCHKLDSSWHVCQSCNEGKQKCYISSKYLANDNDFIKICEERNRKDLSTLLLLEQLYSDKGNYEKAIASSIEITDQYRKSTHPSKELICALYRDLPVCSIVWGKQNTIIYKSSILSDYCTKLINERHDSLLVAWGLVTLSRCYRENELKKKEIELLLTAIKDYGRYLIKPVSCEKNRYDLIEYMNELNGLDLYTPIEMDNTFGFSGNLKDVFSKICDDPKADIGSKAIACNLMLKLSY